MNNNQIVESEKYIKKCDYNKYMSTVNHDKTFQNSSWKKNDSETLKKQLINNKFKKNKVHICENKKKRFNKFYLRNNILCVNILQSGKCPHGNKCVFAHSYKEQIINNDKQQALNLLNNNNLKDIDLIEDTKLYNNLHILTKLCNECVNNICPGGYNCRHGACNEDILICNNDFNKGDCKNFVEKGSCINGSHLTLKGLIPYVKQQLLHDFPNERFLKQALYKDNKNYEDNNWTIVSRKKKKFNKEYKKKEPVIRAKRVIKSIINLDEINNNSIYSNLNNDFMYDTDISSDEEETL